MGTRVPEKTGVPPMTSGLRETTGFSMYSAYSQPAKRCNSRSNGRCQRRAGKLPAKQGAGLPAYAARRS
jgi:hypothetical protein